MAATFALIPDNPPLQVPDWASGAAGMGQTVDSD